MPQRLFKVSKVGLFLDNYVPSMEKRKGGEVKVLTLTLRCQPFDSKLALAIDDGVGEGSNVRPTLFQLSHPDPKPHLQRVNFALGCPRQNLTIFASPDTAESRIMLDQVRISGTYARTEKNVNGYAFVFKASYGPVGRTEQEYIHEWMLTQRFVTFEESEPGLDYDVDDDDETDADEKAREVVSRPPPMWNDEPASQEVAAADEPPTKKEPARRMPRRHADPKTAAKAKQKAGRSAQS